MRLWTSQIICANAFTSATAPRSSVAGAHVRSEGAIRSFWVFLSLSLLVDCVWVYKSSGLAPFTWEQLEQLQRQARAPGGKPCT